MFVVTVLGENEHQNLVKVVQNMLNKYRLLERVEIEVIKITPEMSEPFTLNLEKEKINEEKVIEEVSLDARFEPEKIENLRKLTYYQNIQNQQVVKMKR